MRRLHYTKTPRIERMFARGFGPPWPRPRTGRPGQTNFGYVDMPPSTTSVVPVT
jgi:hypothetical protein